MRPQIYNWKWEEGKEFPPIKFIKAAKLYSDPMYGPQLEKMKTPVPTPAITTSSSEATYQTVVAHGVGGDADVQYVSHAPLFCCWVLHRRL